MQWGTEALGALAASVATPGVRFAAPVNQSYPRAPPRITTEQKVCRTNLTRSNDSDFCARPPPSFLKQ